jgi:hypothetical protein
MDYGLSLRPFKASSDTLINRNGDTVSLFCDGETNFTAIMSLEIAYMKYDPNLSLLPIVD